jgi:sensor domain CHASE-containing protein
MKLFKTIRSQSYFTISAMLTIAIILTITFVVVVSTRSLNEIEQKNGELQMSRIESSIEFSLDSMSRNVKDWAFGTTLITMSLELTLIMKMITST